MSRSQAIALPIGVLFLMLVAFFVANINRGMPADGQVRLDAYLTTHVSSVEPAYQAVKAKHPAQFDTRMSHSVYGESVYYQTADNGEAASLSSISDMYNISEGALRPVPYPPSELWCVRLLDKEDQNSKLVFLALHQDLYNADWLIHTPSAGVNQAAFQVGCPNDAIP